MTGGLPPTVREPPPAPIRSARPWRSAHAAAKIVAFADAAAMITPEMRRRPECRALARHDIPGYFTISASIAARAPRRPLA